MPVVLAFFLARAVKSAYRKRRSFEFQTLAPQRILGAAGILVIVDLATARRLHAMDHCKRTSLSSSGDRGRILYVSHNGLTEPLGRRQVLPYVAGLAARGFDVTVVSYEKAETAEPEAMARVR